MSRSTEKNYLHWAKRFFDFHKARISTELAGEEIVQFLNFLADGQNVAAATQNQALNAIIFLFREVFKTDPGALQDISWARKPRHIPAVLSVQEVKSLLSELKGVQWIIGSLLYGTGMRLTEALRLRVKDIDFDRNLITIRVAKGEKDRTVPLPKYLREPLKMQLCEAKKRHDTDLSEGFGDVYLPHALERKYPNANRQWCWQYVFPSHKRSLDPRSGKTGRHHLYESVMQEAMARAVKAAGISKKVSCHTFRHSYATHLLDSGENIRTVQELLGHNDLKTTMIYTQVTAEKSVATLSPLDRMMCSGDNRPSPPAPVSSTPHRTEEESVVLRQSPTAREETAGQSPKVQTLQSVHQAVPQSPVRDRYLTLTLPHWLMKLFGRSNERGPRLNPFA